METEKQQPNRYRKPGLRYETCCECGMEWNISQLAQIPPSGYLCPVCWSKNRYREEAKRIAQLSAKK